MLWLSSRRGLSAPDMPSSSGAGTALQGSLLRDGLGLFSTVVVVPELDFGDPVTMSICVGAAAPEKPSSTGGSATLECSLSTGLFPGADVAQEAALSKPATMLNGEEPASPGKSSSRGVCMALERSVMTEGIGLVEASVVPHELDFSEHVTEGAYFKTSAASSLPVALALEGSTACAAENVAPLLTGGPLGTRGFFSQADGPVLPRAPAAGSSGIKAQHPHEIGRNQRDHQLPHGAPEAAAPISDFGALDAPQLMYCISGIAAGLAMMRGLTM